MNEWMKNSLSGSFQPPGAASCAKSLFYHGRNAVHEEMHNMILPGQYCLVWQASYPGYHLRFANYFLH